MLGGKGVTEQEMGTVMARYIFRPIYIPNPCFGKISHLGSIYIPNTVFYLGKHRIAATGGRQKKI